ncbi:MAG: thiamine pyrophosphate-dependent enzyme [Actinomycetota bacterium]|nr:thiamine pyrophosphate-dependent enzyme [Actinomycetota bacterium]
MTIKSRAEEGQICHARIFAPAPPRNWWIGPSASSSPPTHAARDAPVALALKLAYPERTVSGFLGDGDAIYTIQAL